MYKVPSIDLTGAVYEYYLTAGALKIEDISKVFICVCEENGEFKAYIYRKDADARNYNFFYLNGVKSAWVFDESTYKSKNHSSEYLISWNDKNCYGRLQEANGKFYFSLA